MAGRDSTVSTATVTTATAARIKDAASGSDPRRARSEKMREAAGIQRLFAVPAAPQRAGKLAPLCWTMGGRFAKRPPSRRLFRTRSGRIAQLVEQLTLNQRVPGSSPGAPTKLFKVSQLVRRRRAHDVC